MKPACSSADDRRRATARPARVKIPEPLIRLKKAVGWMLDARPDVPEGHKIADPPASEEAVRIAVLKGRS